MTVLRTASLVAGFVALLFTGTAHSSEQAKTGIVKVISKPTGANVRVAGKTFGPTPVLIELPAGKHEMVVTRDGHAPVAKSVHVKKDKLIRAEIKLGTSPKKGIRVHRTGKGGADSGPATVTVATSPPGLSVFMDDSIVPQPTPVAFDVRAGIYEMTLEERGQVVYRKTVFARAGRTLELDLIVKRRRRIDDSDPWTD